MISSPPTLSSSADMLSTPPPTLSSPQPLLLLPSVSDVPVTATCPPLPSIPQCCCALVAPPPPRDSPSMLERMIVSTFGRICTGVLISGLIYAPYLAFCQCRRDPPLRRPSGSRGPQSHPHSASSVQLRGPDTLPVASSAIPHYPFDISTEPGLGCFIPNRFGFGF